MGYAAIRVLPLPLAFAVVGLLAVPVAGCGATSVDVTATGDLEADVAELDNDLGTTCIPAQALSYPGDTLLLRGNVRHSDNKAVSWHTSDGVIGDDRVLTVPDHVGTVTVTAIALADGKSAAQCKITVVNRPKVDWGDGEGAKISVHTALGLPNGASTSSVEGYLIERPEYVLSYNGKRKGPNWVSWELNGTYIGGAARSQNWKADRDLPQDVPQARNADYVRSGFDRGHMCPSADRTRLEPVNAETFVMTNVLPQLRELNSGPWEDLEAYLRSLAIKNNKEVFIVAGGVFGQTPGVIGEGVEVPAATWKVAVVMESLGHRAPDVTRSTRVIAVLMPNSADSVTQKSSWRDYRVRVRDIEQQTGYDLLSDVASDVQDVVENRIDDEGS